MKQVTKSKAVIFVGGNGCGKTTMALKEMGNRPYVIYQANDIRIDDVYSYPKNHGIIIEDVHHKPQKDKLIQLLCSANNIVLTSINEKSVPKAIMNLCVRKRMGQKDLRQVNMKTIAPNCNSIMKYEMSMYDINMQFLKNSNRKEVVELIKYNKPADLQLLSWVQPNVNINCIIRADNIMRRWRIDYFYEILSYSYEGNHKGRVEFPKRNAYSPVPKICNKLGLKGKDSYLVKLLLEDDAYKEWATSVLDNDECKILGLTKPRKKTIRIVNTKLGDY
tara:strand:+ start:1074 stop:1904 length:831 start_codon:yes stop_codon:yes gene_type:complete